MLRAELTERCEHYVELCSHRGSLDARILNSCLSCDFAQLSSFAVILTFITIAHIEINFSLPVFKYLSFCYYTEYPADVVSVAKAGRHLVFYYRGTVLTFFLFESVTQEMRDLHHAISHPPLHISFFSIFLDLLMSLSTSILTYSDASCFIRMKRMTRRVRWYPTTWRIQRWGVPLFLQRPDVCSAVLNYFKVHGLPW